MNDTFQSISRASTADPVTRIITSAFFEMREQWAEPTAVHFHRQRIAAA